MYIRNIYEEIKKASIDPAVGIGISPIIENEEVSFHIALVEKTIKKHYHKERDEIYYIVEGKGVLMVNEEKREVKTGDVILIPKGSTHTLTNTGEKPLILAFISVPAFAPEKDRFFVE